LRTSPARSDRLALVAAGVRLSLTANSPKTDGGGPLHAAHWGKPGTVNPHEEEGMLTNERHAAGGTAAAGAPAAYGSTGVTDPVVVATDGRVESDAALLAAMTLLPGAAPLSVVAVLEPMPYVTPEVQIPMPPETELARERALRTRVEQQMTRVPAARDGALLEIRRGAPAAAIAQTAEDLGARMIVLGLGRHGVMDRVFGSETALHVLRAARVPVLAVPESFAPPIRHAVVAMDFSETSLRAVRDCLALVADDGIVHVAHVVPREVAMSTWDGWSVAYQRDVEREWARLLAAVTPGRGIRLERVDLRGDAATEILALCESLGADLLAMGSHGHGFISRLLLGGVATRLLRGARCAVLGVPFHTAPPAVGEVPTVAGARVAVHQWTLQLDALSRRNIGRRGMLEVDHPDIGAQAQEHDYQFMGATYDHHDRRVELMFGSIEGTGPHLTRGIADVRSIDIQRDAEGRDLALRIAHGGGQTLLTFRW
jgi:nucleotide-binding universal stress UspA family protein